MKKYQVVTICNALVDILSHVEDNHLDQLAIQKGVMHLVDNSQQRGILDQLQAAHMHRELGGSGMNTIRALARLGQNTVFSGQVGRDDFGALIRERLERLGIEARLQETEDATGSSLVLVTPDGERTMNTCLGASSKYDRSLVPVDAIKASHVFHFCGYQWDTPPQIEAINEAIQVAKAAGTRISFDVADPFVVGRNREAFLDLIEKDADIVFANREEAKMLYDLSPEAAAQKIGKDGTVAVIKLGAEGALVCDQGEVIKVDPVPTQSVDTTAAGDMFAAGFLYGMAVGADHHLSGQCAATLASDVISRLGASLSDEAIEKLKRLATS